MSKTISRRTMLRGLAGTAIALPLLECMWDSRTASAGESAKRYLLTFGGFSLNKGLNGTPLPQAFRPDAFGPGYDLKTAVQPLAGYADGSGKPVRDVVTLVSGLDIPHASDVNNIPPGARYIGDSFHFHSGPLLCGTKQIHELNAEVTGPSSDQLVANLIGNSNTFKSLTYRAQASFYNPGSGNFHRDTMSFAKNGSQISAIAPQISPKQAYDQLFTGFTPDDPAEAAKKALELSKRKSVLDLVDRNMSGLMPRLGAYDRERMERHYDEIRAIEKLLDAAPVDQIGACELLEDPGADPPVGGDFPSPFGGYQSNLGYSNEDLRADTFNKLVHMAFVCDLTRVTTLMYTMFQSFMNIQPLTGAAFNQHAMNHNGTQAQLDATIAWHVDKFAQLVAMLRDTPEGGGSVLDSCALAFIPEGGFRTSSANIPGGVSHNTENMCILVAGGAGGLVQGQHIQAPASANHPANLLLTLMEAVGAPSASLGDISGTIPALTS